MDNELETRIDDVMESSNTATVFSLMVELSTG